MRVWGLLLLCACRGLPDTFESVGTGTYTPPFAVAPPAAPASPALPVLTPCPAGWREVDAGVIVCEPWPEGGRATCTGDNAHFPGEPGCSRVGEACAADGWPTQLPAGRPIVYVRAGAAAGNGSKASPFGSLAQALAGGGAGKVLALAPGSYEPPGPLPANTVLWGACVAQTVLTVGPASTLPAVVYVFAAGVEVHQLRVTGPVVGVGVSGTTAQLSLADVVVDGATGLGLLLQTGARVTGQNLVVRSTQTRADGTLGGGVHVVDGAMLTVSRGVISSNRNVGVFVFNPGADVTLEQVAVWGNPNQGAWVNAASTLRIGTSVLEDNGRTGAHALSRGTLELTDVVIRRTAVTGAGTGQNVWVDGAQLTARRVRSDDCEALGIGVQGASTVTIDDLVSRRENGLGANSGAQVALHRALMHENVGSAFLSRLDGTQLSVVDVAVLDPQPPASQPFAAAVNVIRGGAFAATRMHVTHGRGSPLSATSAGSRLELTDVTIDDTLPGADGEGGFPLGVSVGATGSFTRVQIRGGSVIGLYVFQGASATLTDIDIRDIRPPASQGGLYGNGLVAAEGATVRGTRVHIAGTGDTAVLAEGAGTSIELTEASIVGTTLECRGNPDCANRVPVGVSAQVGAAVKLSRFLVAWNGGIGVQVADTAQLDLSDGEVSFHQLGANVLPADYDVERLNQNVVYRFHERNLAAQVVPLPKTAPIPSPPP
ncbi:MAG: hypothetical protein JNK82_17575 [Myxococcaceae bacterium]|nr:hypothetical protein [Myxococcaceae bacterium]